MTAELRSAVRQRDKTRRHTRNMRIIPVLVAELAVTKALTNATAEALVMRAAHMPVAKRPFWRKIAPGADYFADNRPETDILFPGWEGLWRMR